MLDKCIAKQALDPIQYFLERAEKDFLRSPHGEEKQILFTNAVMLKRLKRALIKHIDSTD